MQESQQVEQTSAINNQIAEAIAAKRATLTTAPTTTATPTHQSPVAKLNLPPWGIPSIILASIAAVTGLILTNMILSHDPVARQQEALIESQQENQETLAVTTAEAVKNAGMRINIDGCLGQCDGRKNGVEVKQEDPYAFAPPVPSPTPTPSSVEPVASPSPTPTPVATPMEMTQSNNVPGFFDEDLYRDWYEHYYREAQTNAQGFQYAASTFTAESFNSPEQQQAFLAVQNAIN